MRVNKLGVLVLSVAVAVPSAALANGLTERVHEGASAARGAALRGAGRTAVRGGRLAARHATRVSGGRINVESAPEGAHVSVRVGEHHSEVTVSRTGQSVSGHGNFGRRAFNVTGGFEEHAANLSGHLDGNEFAFQAVDNTPEGRESGTGSVTGHYTANGQRQNVNVRIKGSKSKLSAIGDVGPHALRASWSETGGEGAGRTGRLSVTFGKLFALRATGGLNSLITKGHVNGRKYDLTTTTEGPSLVSRGTYDNRNVEITAGGAMEGGVLNAQVGERNFHYTATGAISPEEGSGAFQIIGTHDGKQVADLHVSGTTQGVQVQGEAGGKTVAAEISL